MKIYDVVIVGAGPAGLYCAEILSGTDLSVLLLEKNDTLGIKVCAGGITGKDIKLLDIPVELFEHRISATRLLSVLNYSFTNAARPFMYTVSRRELAEYQRSRITGENVEVMTGAQVTKVENDRVTVNNKEEIGFRHLVGADGYSSIVRRFLRLPVKEKLIGMQYQVPLKGQAPRFEIHLHAYYFHSWYGWVFPHQETLAVGCVADPRYLNAAKLKIKFHKWLEKKGFDISGAKYESQPVGCDYRGWEFGNIFLAGEAGGFASWFTGEGIYQALVSGKAVAEEILDTDHHSVELEEVLRYNRVLRKVLKVFLYAGPFRYVLHELLILLMKSRFVKSKINKGFTGSG